MKGRDCCWTMEETFQGVAKPDQRILWRRFKFSLGFDLGSDCWGTPVAPWWRGTRCGRDPPWDAEGSVETLLSCPGWSIFSVLLSGEGRWWFPCFKKWSDSRGVIWILSWLWNQSELLRRWWTFDQTVHRCFVEDLLPCFPRNPVEVFGYRSQPCSPSSLCGSCLYSQHQVQHISKGCWTPSSLSPALFLIFMDVSPGAAGVRTVLGLGT